MGKVSRETPKPSSSSNSPQLTTSTSITDTVNGSHQFKIAGYTLSKGLGIGKYIASETFMVGGYAWAIYFYPDGKSVEDNATYVSMFIALVSEGTDVRALFELTLLDQSGKERHKVHSHFGRTLEGGPYALKYRGSMWGYKRFFKRTHLETSDYLKDDCLSVHCSVGVVRSHTEGPKVYSLAVPPPNIGQHFGKLLESGKRTDVNFEVDGEIFAAHKLVLAARSPVFMAQLYGPMKDQNTQCIKVEDMEAPVFKALLHFIYWDSLPDLEELIGLNTKWASTLIGQHLLAAADRYGLERLRLLCEGNLCEDVAVNTVATTLALAEQHHCFQLKAVCLKFVAMPENLREIQNMEGKITRCSGEKNYLCWCNLMDRELANILRDERNLGNKGDGGWKSSAYNSAAKILSAQFAKNITGDNVKNRLKLWKKYYGIVSDILAQSGFSWDSSKLMITVDDEFVWNEYVKSHEGAKKFRWKVIPNWDDIVDLCGKDRATGGGAETPFDVVDNWIEDDGDRSDSNKYDQTYSDTPTRDNSITRDSISTQRNKRKALASTATSPSKKIEGKKMKMEDAISKMASSVDLYFSSKSKAMGIDEVYDVVSAIPELGQSIFFKVCKWLMEDEKKFQFLKKLPEDMRKNYVLESMPNDGN